MVIGKSYSKQILGVAVGTQATYNKKLYCIRQQSETNDANVIINFTDKQMTDTSLFSTPFMNRFYSKNSNYSEQNMFSKILEKWQVNTLIFANK